MPIKVKKNRLSLPLDTFMKNNFSTAKVSRYGIISAMTKHTVNSITITQPDDWHLHLRDNNALQRTVADAARCFKRAVIMPNLQPPVTTTKQAAAYRQRILAARPAGSQFDPLMTLYLTDKTTPEEITTAVKSDFVKAVKLYPAGATTNSA